MVSLEDIAEDDDHAEAEPSLAALLKQEEENRPSADSTMGKKVDSLIGRMDRFMNCFADLHATVTKNQRTNDKKFKHLESVHNEFAVKITNSVSNNRERIEQLELQLEESTSANTSLADRITQLEKGWTKRESRQDQINDQHSNEIKNLRIEQGFTNRNVQDCFSETKERKLIISGVNETASEDTANVALGCLNKVISTAISRVRPEDQP